MAVLIQRVFPAKFDSPCQYCGRTMREVVDRVAKLTNGKYVHSECAVAACAKANAS